MITILGLGPGDPKYWTTETREVLEHASEIWLRTREHPAVAALPASLTLHSFDRVYEQHTDFAVIYETIAGQILERAAQGKEVLYAVPGHPLVGEIAVGHILAQARERGFPVRVVTGVSFIDAALVALGLDPLAQGLQIVDALDLAREHFPRLDTDRPALVGQLYSRTVASDCKLTLLVNYPPDYSVTLVHRAGLADQELHIVPLSELDRADEFGLLTALYLPPLPHPSSPLSLAEIMATLRAPEGCPWDREQTPQSLRAALLEETYEVLETLDQDDMPALREELGDLLLHVLFQTQMASEGGEFTLAEVGGELAAKLIRRHPHVFGDVQVRGAADVVENWDKIKQTEKKNRDRPAITIPRGLPALARAEKVARKKGAAFTLAEVTARVQALARARNRETAVGEAMYALAAYAAGKHLDAESALRAAADREAAAPLPAPKKRAPAIKHNKD